MNVRNDYNPYPWSDHGYLQMAMIYNVHVTFIVYASIVNVCGQTMKYHDYYHLLFMLALWMCVVRPWSIMIICDFSYTITNIHDKYIISSTT